MGPFTHLGTHMRPPLAATSAARGGRAAGQESRAVALVLVQHGQKLGATLVGGLEKQIGLARQNGAHRGGAMHGEWQWQPPSLQPGKARKHRAPAAPLSPACREACCSGCSLRALTAWASAA